MSASTPIDVVAHSMGGLVTRAYLHSHAQSGDVDRVFTLGTPHVGTMYLLGVSNSPLPIQESLRQMDPFYLRNYFEPQFNQTRGARFVLFGSSTNRNRLGVCSV